MKTFQRRCGTKKRYYSEEAAIEVMNASTEKPLLNVYFCCDCHYWHIGHIKGASKQVIKCGKVYELS
jgi:hypothetical protein